MIKDPRGLKRQTKFTNGKNTESFDPRSTLVRPDMRILCKSKNQQLTHMYNDDVILVPNFVSDFYYDLLLQELDECQQNDVKEVSMGKENTRVGWTGLHENEDCFV